MAETVGSVMGNHTGKGRYLTPENFGKELYLGECFGILVTYSDPEFNPGGRHMTARSPPTSPAWPTMRRAPRWPPSGRSTWTRRTCPSSYGSSSRPAVRTERRDKDKYAVRRRRPGRYSSDSLLLDI